jgi:hypothetical protein
MLLHKLLFFLLPFVPLPKSHPRPGKFVAAEKRTGIKKSSKASLNEDFMSLFPTHPYFRNSAEEFYPHETLSTPMKLLSSLFINKVSHQHN